MDDGISEGSPEDNFPDSFIEDGIVDAEDLTLVSASDSSTTSNKQQAKAKKTAASATSSSSSSMTPSSSTPLDGVPSKTFLPVPHSYPMHPSPYQQAMHPLYPPPSMFMHSQPVMATVLATSQEEEYSDDSQEGTGVNHQGYEVCGALNKFNKPCQRIGKNCPFHPKSRDSSPVNSPQQVPPTSPRLAKDKRVERTTTLPLPIKKKGPYKRGWTKDEHLRFLKGLQFHGKGSWKEIAGMVGTRTPSQIQVHAHRYFSRQQQNMKNKRSIHDFTLEDLIEMESSQHFGFQLPGQYSAPYSMTQAPHHPQQPIPFTFQSNMEYQASQFYSPYAMPPGAYGYSFPPQQQHMTSPASPYGYHYMTQPPPYPPHTAPPVNIPPTTTPTPPPHMHATIPSTQSSMMSTIPAHSISSSGSSGTTMTPSNTPKVPSIEWGPNGSTDIGAYHSNPMEHPPANEEEFHRRDFHAKHDLPEIFLHSEIPNESIK